MTTAIATGARRALVRCALSAGLVWALLFCFGREIHYVGDDFTVLAPLFHGGLVESLHEYVRPLEYGAAWLSLQLNFSAWLLVSLLAYVATACATVTLANMLTRTSEVPWWIIALCATSPLAAMPYFQVDTVSQALANLFSLLFASAVIRRVATGLAKPRESLWPLVLLAALCVASKETSYGIVAAGSCLVLLKFRRAALLEVACIFVLLFAATAWSKLAGTLDITTTHYALKANPLYWLFGIVFSAAVTVTPIPTSSALTGTYASNATTLAIVSCGLAVVVLAIVLAVKSSATRAAWRNRATLLDLWAPVTLVVVFLLASVVPSIFFKVSELYASQMLPFGKALLILAIYSSGRAAGRRFAVLCSLAWLMASSVNLIFYSISSGYDPAGDARLGQLRRPVYLDLQQAVRNQRSQYSMYSVNMFFSNIVEGDCELRPGAGYACLPKNIGAGFPIRRIE